MLIQLTNRCRMDYPGATQFCPHCGMPVWRYDGFGATQFCPHCGMPVWSSAYAGRQEGDNGRQA